MIVRQRPAFAGPAAEQETDPVRAEADQNDPAPNLRCHNEPDAEEKEKDKRNDFDETGALACKHFEV